MNKLPSVLKKIQMIITDLGLMKCKLLRETGIILWREKQMELLFLQQLAGMSTEKEALSIFF